MGKTQAVRVVLGQCLQVKPQETLVIVVDETTRDLGTIFHREGVRMGERGVGGLSHSGGGLGSGKKAA